MDSLAVWFLVSLFLKTSFSSCPDRNDYDVLIFGAGAAGVTAARILHDSGVTNIKILEAHNKIGGRIRSKTFNGVRIEVGANWIHEAPGMNDMAKGNSINPIWELAQNVCHVEGQVALSGIYTNKDIFMDKVNGQYQEDTNTVAEIKSTYKEKYDAALNTTDVCNISRTVRNGLDDQEWNPNTTLKQLFEWSEFDFTYGTTPENSSLYYTAENDKVQFGDSCYIVTDQRGFASVLECLAKPFNDTISLNVTVDSIELHQNCVCAQVEGQDRMCAEYGIVTFSIGVLQDWLNNNSFNGSLSDEKMKAINNSEMGLYLKIFVKFPSNVTFWNTTAHYIYFTNETRGYYPVIQPIGVELGEPSIMLMTVTGEEAKRLSALTKNEIKMEILTVLRERYGSDIVPDITLDDIEYHDWYEDKFFRGMFSNNPNTLQLNDKKNLAEPEGNLYFSGEANSIEHGGTIHGAYCSGIDAATDILRRKGIDENSSIPKCNIMASPSPSPTMECPSPSMESPSFSMEPLITPTCVCKHRQSTKELKNDKCPCPLSSSSSSPSSGPLSSPSSSPTSGPPSDPSSAISIRVSLFLTLFSTLMVFSALMIFSV